MIVGNPPLGEDWLETRKQICRFILEIPGISKILVWNASKTNKKLYKSKEQQKILKPSRGTYSSPYLLIHAIKNTKKPGDTVHFMNQLFSSQNEKENQERKKFIQNISLNLGKPWTQKVISFLTKDIYSRAKKYKGKSPKYGQTNSLTTISKNLYKNILHKPW